MPQLQRGPRVKMDKRASKYNINNVALLQTKGVKNKNVALGDT